MNIQEQQRLYLQTIFDYFHEKAEWPTYSYIDKNSIMMQAWTRRRYRRAYQAASRTDFTLITTSGIKRYSRLRPYACATARRVIWQTSLPLCAS